MEEELVAANPLAAANADFKTLLQEKLRLERRPGLGMR